MTRTHYLRKMAERINQSIPRWVFLLFDYSWDPLLQTCHTNPVLSELHQFCTCVPSPINSGSFQPVNLNVSTESCPAWRYRAGLVIQSPSNPPASSPTPKPGTKKRLPYLFACACLSGGWEQWPGTEVQPWSPEIPQQRDEKIEMGNVPCRLYFLI